MTRREAGISASSRSRSRVMDKHREGTRFGAVMVPFNRPETASSGRHGRMSS
ncbi:hypothetical protein HMPREF9565_00877 [Cutibacterium acnes HL053PA2]|nr:hypothetical protein HMPREF9565_00877 [Cutibacterium acnes HL053PA2]